MLVRGVTDTFIGLAIIVFAMLASAGLNAAHQSDLAGKRKALDDRRYVLENWRHACLQPPNEQVVTCYDMQHRSYAMRLGEESISYVSKTRDIPRRPDGLYYRATGEFDLLGQRTADGGYEIVVNSGRAHGRLLPLAGAPGSYHGTLTYPSEPDRRARFCFGPDLDLCRYVVYVGLSRAP